ncbi:uncharacterized protein LOC128554504, partial [Mercenaria mercenaria]|uniref:uncharacterized protein LOC128554504 n=1 Tax=Mercenaria mercenaria TaxID=6596 RepID=UPI00234F8605
QYFFQTAKAVIYIKNFHYFNRHGVNFEFVYRGGARLRDQYQRLLRNLHKKVNFYGSVTLYVWLGTCDLTCKDFRSLLREIRKVEQKELVSVSSSSSTKPKVVQQHSSQVEANQVETQTDSNALVLKQLQELMSRMKTLESKMESSIASNANSQSSGARNSNEQYSGNFPGNCRGRFNNPSQARGRGRGYGRYFRRDFNRGNVRDRGNAPINQQNKQPDNLNR